MRRQDQLSGHPHRLPLVTSCSRVAISTTSSGRLRRAQPLSSVSNLAQGLRAECSPSALHNTMTALFRHRLE